jgi:hypothetical protein
MELTQTNIIVVGGIFLVLIGVLFYFISTSFKEKIPTTLEEAKLDLRKFLNGVSGIVSIETEGTKIVINYEFFPHPEKLNMMPIVYQGYPVETRLLSEEDFYKLK